MNSRVLNFEYGVYALLETSVKTYIKAIIALGDYDLKYSDKNMKIYGKENLLFKIYDAIANAKAKKTFSLGQYPNGDLIKFELKLINPSKYFNRDLTVEQLCKKSFEYKLQSRLESHINSIVESNISLIEPRGSTVTHYLYALIKNYEQITGLASQKMILQMIEGSDITSAQKSKRRKSIKILEDIYQN